MVRRPATVLVALVALAFGDQIVLASPVQAIVARTGAGRLVSYQPTRSQAARARNLAGAHLGLPATTGSPQTAAATYQQCNGTGACLSYYGGQVMRTTTLTAIFWNPGGSLSYPANYESEIEQFITDVATDSGKESDFFSVLPQYYEEAAGGKINHVSYSVTATAAQTDTASLPSETGEKCTSPTSPSRPCVSDLGVKNQLISFIKAHSLATGVGHEYIVFFPPGMESCFAESGEGGEICSGSYYCGYHGALKAGTSEEVEYANEPDNADPAYGFNCLPEAGLKAGYATVDSTSHEVSESVTDPDVGALIAGKEVLSWYDEESLFVEPGLEPEYGEVGDMCAYEYQQGDSALEPYLSHKIDSNGKPNQTIDGHSYLLQLEWDNAHSTCSLSAEAAATKATFTDTASPGMRTDEAISFDATGSRGPLDKHILNAIQTYEWHWGDGTVTSTASPTTEHAYTSSQGVLARTFTVTLTVIDKHGDKASTSHTVEIEDRPPTASFAAPAGATAGAQTLFDGSGSSDPDGTIAGYEWAFGDGTTGTGASPGHVYAAAGEYTATLTVTDDAGNKASVSHSVSVAAPPPAEIAPTVTVATTNGTTGNNNPSKPLRVIAVKQNKKKGSVALSVSVPGAGALSAREASSAHGSLVAPLAGALVAPSAYPAALLAVTKGKGKAAKGPFIKPVSVTVNAGGTVTIQIVPNAAGGTLLKSKHRLPVKILIAFTPTGGAQGTIVQPVTLVLSAAKKRK